MSENSKFVIGVRLPEKLYSLLVQTPDLSGTLNFNPATMNLVLNIAEKENDPESYSADLEPSDDTILFSVDSIKTPKYKGKISSKGVLLPVNPLKNFKKLEIEEKASIFIDSSSNLPLKPTTAFKLHDFHDIFVMYNKDQAINKIIRKKYKETKKKEEETSAILKLQQLFNIQKYWKIKNLSDETSMPEYFIRDILKKIGKKTQNKDYKNFWELQINNS